MTYSESVYHQYKRLTSYVISWLVVAGTAAGCPPSLIEPSPEKRTATTYHLQLVNFVPLAESIERSQVPVHVPRSILKDLGRVIDLRLRFSQVLRGRQQPTADDKSHGYFIDVLRELQKVLQRLPTTQARSKTTAESSPSASFSLLEMEDVPDEEESDVVERQEVLALVDDKIEYTYATENIPPIEEAAVHFQLLLDDFRRLAQHVHKQWDKYIAGTVDLAAAAATTNMAILFAKGLEDTARDNIVRIMAADHDRRQTTITQLSKQMNMTEQVIAAFLDGNIYFPLYNFLLGANQATDMPEDYRLEQKVLHTTFMAVTSWFFKLCFRQKVSGNLVRGQEIDHSYIAPWGEQSVGDKRRKLTAFAMETATELHFIGSLREKAPIQDELSRNTFRCIEEKKLYVSAVFGIDLLHAIHTKLHDSNVLAKPLSTLHRFLASATTRMSELSTALPAEANRTTLEPMRKYTVQAQTDIFRALKAANKKAGIDSNVPFFTLRRHPILCGLLLLAERALAQDTALTLERNLGGLTAAIHLGHAFTTSGVIPSLGTLKPTTTRQPDTAFYIGGKRPTEKSQYLSAYSLAIGESITNTAPTNTSARNRGSDVPLATRKQKLELTVPAPFSRAVLARLRDPHGRVSLSEADLVEMLLGTGHAMMRKVYGEGQASEAGKGKGKGKAVKMTGPKPAPLNHASLLLHAEVPVLEHEYLDALRVAWEALRAVQAALGGPMEGLGQAGSSRGRAGRGRRRGGRGGRGAGAGGQENEIDPAEVVVGRVFEDATSESVFEAAGKAFGKVVAIKKPVE